jgi:hypothetical protein
MSLCFYLLLGNKNEKNHHVFIVLIIAYSPIYALLLEQWNASSSQMTIADMGMRTRNGIGVEMLKLLTI